MRKFGGITFFKKNPGAEVISSDQLLDKSHSSTPQKKTERDAMRHPLENSVLRHVFLRDFEVLKCLVVLALFIAEV